MESSSTSGKTSDPASHRLARFIGTTIAVLTLTIPLLAINYSSPTQTEPLAGNSYSLRNLNQ